MDRVAWMREKRRKAEVRYDTLFAHDYDRDWGHINQTHRIFLERLLTLCPAHGVLLDAACGTGKYWPMILASEHSVVGIDQSAQMLAQAKRKFPAVSVEKKGLQELDYSEAFDGVLCVDAMEFVFPEDWPRVLDNFYRALKSRRYLYLTVEVIDEQELTTSFAMSKQKGLPVVEGEYAHEESYHYYPAIEQVKQWLHAAHFNNIEEAEGDGYYHFLVQKQAERLEVNDERAA